jgi:hypothetical protein
MAIFLVHGMPVVCQLLGSLLLLALVRCRRYIAEDLCSSSRRTGIAVLCTLGLFLYLVIFQVGHFHREVIDEYWFVEWARNLALGKGFVDCWYVGLDETACRQLTDMPAWPTAIASVSVLAGVGSWTAIRLSIFCGLATVALTFLVGRALFGDLAGLVAAVFLAVNPVHLIWSATAANNVFALALVLLVVYLSLLYMRSREPWLLLACMLALCVSLLSRVEYTLFIMPLAMLLRAEGAWPPRHHWRYAILPLALVALVYLPMVRMKADHPKNVVYTGDLLWNQSIQYLFKVAIGFYILLPAEILVLVALLMVDRTERRSVVALGAWFLVFFLFYNTWLSEGQDRLFLVTLVPLFLLAGLGARLLRARFGIHELVTLTVCLLFAIGPLDTLSRGEEGLGSLSWNALATRLVNDWPFDSDCYIISEEPSLYMSTGVARAVAARAVLDDPSLVRELVGSGACVRLAKNASGSLEPELERLMAILQGQGYSLIEMEAIGVPGANVTLYAPLAGRVHPLSV